MKQFAAKSLYCSRCDLYCTVSVRIKKGDSSKQRLGNPALELTPAFCPFCGRSTTVDILLPELHVWKKGELVE